jgi:hypothetical protein
MYTVLTNNNVVAEFFKQKKELGCAVKWVSAPAMDVLTAARAAVRQGAVLVSNPMAGVNMPAVRAPDNARRLSTVPRPAIFNPYLTLLVTGTGETVDFQSLKGLNEALALYKKNARLRFIAHDDNAIQHFQMVDFQIALKTVSELLKTEIDV